MSLLIKKKLACSLVGIASILALVGCNRGTSGNENKSLHNLTIEENEHYYVSSNLYENIAKDTPLTFTIETLDDDYYIDGMFFNDVSVGTRVDRYTFTATMLNQDVKVTFSLRSESRPKDVSEISFKGSSSLSGIITELSIGLPLVVGSSYSLDGLTPDSSTGETSFIAESSNLKVLEVETDATTNKQSIKAVSDGYTILSFIGTTNKTLLYRRIVQVVRPLTKNTAHTFLKETTFEGIGDSGYDLVKLTFSGESNGYLSGSQNASSFTYKQDTNETSNESFIFTSEDFTAYFGESVQITKLELSLSGYELHLVTKQGYQATAVHPIKWFETNVLKK